MGFKPKSINRGTNLTHGAHQSGATEDDRERSFIETNIDICFSLATDRRIHSNFRIFKMLKMSEYTWWVLGFSVTVFRPFEVVPVGTCHLAAPAENDKRWKRETTKSFPDAKAEKNSLTRCARKADGFDWWDRTARLTGIVLQDFL